MLFAIIISARFPDEEFEESCGFFMFTMYCLVKAGLTIIECKPERFSEISAMIRGCPFVSIKIIIVRGHGNHWSIRLNAGDGPDTLLTVTNIIDIFRDLPDRMADEPLLILESCSTGKFDGDDFINIAAGFAELFLYKGPSNVRIIAPTAKCHLLGVFPAGDSWQFITTGYDGVDLLACYGPSTRAALRQCETTKSNIDEDTKGLTSPDFGYFCEIQKGLGISTWSTPKVAMIALEYNAHNPELFDWLITRMPPSQMLNGDEMKHLNQEILAPTASWLLAFLCVIKISGLAGFIELIKKWADKYELSREVDLILDGIDGSLLISGLSSIFH